MPIAGVRLFFIVFADQCDFGVEARYQFSGIIEFEYYRYEARPRRRGAPMESRLPCSSDMEYVVSVPPVEK